MTNSKYNQPRGILGSAVATVAGLTLFIIGARHYLGQQVQRNLGEIRGLYSSITNDMARGFEFTPIVTAKQLYERTTPSARRDLLEPGLFLPGISQQELQELRDKHTFASRLLQRSI